MRIPSGPSRERAWAALLSSESTFRWVLYEQAPLSEEFVFGRVPMSDELLCPRDRRIDYTEVQLLRTYVFALGALLRCVAMCGILRHQGGGNGPAALRSLYDMIRYDYLHT